MAEFKESSIKEITTEDEWRAHVASLPSSTLLIISFHAPWAAPCATMAAALNALVRDYPVTDPLTTSWVSINAEELSDISETYDVTAVPYLVLQRNDQVIETVSGSNVVSVREAIERNAKKANVAATPTTNGTTAAAEKTPAAPPAAEVEAAPVDPAKAEEELFKRLGDLVKAAPVMLFMKGTPSAPQCGFSRQLVGLLRERSVKYGFFNILADDEVRQGLKKFAEWPTYPQLWVEGELVGGLDIVSYLTTLCLDGDSVANILCVSQVKEELEGDPDFLKPHSVTKQEGAAAA
ncbi:glutaredoxin [Parahypoxylon ruwenzoriense]